MSACAPLTALLLVATPSPPFTSCAIAVPFSAAGFDSGATADSSSTSGTASDSPQAPAAPAHDSVEVTIRERTHHRQPLVPLRDGRHAVHVFVSDAWYVISSPSRMHAHDAAWVLAIAAAGGLTFAYDQEILDAFQRSKGERVYELAVKPGRAIQPVGNMGNTLAYYFGGMGIGYLMHWDPLREITSEFIESHFISGGARNIAEVAIGRRRPFEDFGPRRFEFMGGSSFPSGHASVVFELATILSHHAHFLPFTILCYGAATSAVLERIDSRGHWPSDCVVGAATGYIISRTVVRRHDERRAARDAALGALPGDGRHATIEPEVQWLPGALRVGIRARF